jgi:hypothetical protein
VVILILDELQNLLIMLSKLMKPFVLAQPYICHGSKDLASKIASFNENMKQRMTLFQGRKLWICTGDVVAYYPNIPVDRAINICIQFILKGDHHYFKLINEKRFVEAHEHRAASYNFLKECFDTALKDVVFANDADQAAFYRQIFGMAMGVACAPDVANLYGAFYENDWMDEQSVYTKVLFYNRYIDDCIAFVLAYTKEEALATVQTLHIGICTIEWDASDVVQTFLDMSVYVDSYFHKVCHKPFRKPFNNLERIPWASHHPKDVKKATFLGEMSRLATLSSERYHYDDALSTLSALYLGRGYPPALVSKWLEENREKRWRSRLEVMHGVPDTVSPLVIKSTFYPIWAHVNVKELHSHVLDVWTAPERLPLDQLGEFSQPLGDEAEQRVLKHLASKRLLVSRKRTLNYADVANMWKKSVVATHLAEEADGIDAVNSSQ